MGKLSANLGASLGGYQEPETAPKQTDIEDLTGKPKQPRRKKPQAEGKAWVRGEGKSSNPNYARLSVYVPTALRKKAERKWEDATGKDASDLIESLLTQYVST